MSVNKYDIFLGQVNQEELYFNDSELIREVDILKINQDVRILAEESRVCQLKGSGFAIITNFDFSQGKLFTRLLS